MGSIEVVGGAKLAELIVSKIDVHGGGSSLSTSLALHCIVALKQHNIVSFSTFTSHERILQGWMCPKKNKAKAADAKSVNTRF